MPLDVVNFTSSPISPANFPYYTAKNYRCQTVDRYIGQRMFLCTICALKHLCTNRQPNICAQTIDAYFGRPFAVLEMLICNLIYRK